MPEFSKRYRTIAVDVRGHGHFKPDPSYSIQPFSEDLLGFLERLEISQTHLVGFSIGAAIVQRYALNHPEEVRSLTLLSAFSYDDPHLHNVLTCHRSAIVQGGFSTFFDEAARLVMTPEFASANAGAIAEMKANNIRINSQEAVLRAITACLGSDVKDEISQTSSPTMIIFGEEDVLTPLHFCGANSSIRRGLTMENLRRRGS